jgi:hypothetical protein
VLARLLSRIGQSILRLLLGTDEEDAVSTSNRLAYEGQGGLEARHGLREVDDVDPVALREDVLAHLRIPAPGLVPEVDARFEQLLHAGGSQRKTSGSFLRPASAPVVNRPRRCRDGTDDQQDPPSV